MIRKYRKEDIKRIVELEKKYLLSSLEESFYINDLENPLAYHFVIEEDERIIGFVSSIFDGFSLEILNIVIDKDYQSKGYGTKLFNQVFEEALPHGLKQSILEVRTSNTKAIHFYEKLNYKILRIRKEYYSNGEDALVMLKEFN